MIKYIADIGSNWCIGNDMAENWIHVADIMEELAVNKVDFVKFQAWDTASFVHDKHPQYDTYYKKYELPKEWYKPLVTLGVKFGIKVMFTAFDNITLSALSDLGLDNWKIASSDSTCLPLVKNTSLLADEMYISFGNTTMDEVKTTVEYLKTIKYDGKLNILHCVSKYPLEIKDAGFDRIRELRETFPEYTLGWSSHGTNQNAEYLANIAVAMGAEVLEFHVKSETQPSKSPDYPHSLTPQEISFVMKSTNTTYALVVSKPKLDMHEINWGRRNIYTGKRPTIDPVTEEL